MICFFFVDDSLCLAEGQVEMSSLKGQKNGRSDTSCVKSIHVNTSKGTVPAHPILQTW